MVGPSRRGEPETQNPDMAVSKEGTGALWSAVTVGTQGEEDALSTVSQLRERQPGFNPDPSDSSDHFSGRKLEALPGKIK